MDGEEDVNPFQPADGVTPRWKKLYDLVIGREVGDEVTYREAIDLLGFDRKTDRTLKVTQNAMREAVAHLEKDGQRTVGVVKNFGWIILDPTKELQQVDRRLTKTRRAAGRVVRGANALSTRRGELSQFEREKLDQVSRAGQMAAQISGRKRLDLESLRKQLDTA